MKIQKNTGVEIILSGEEVATAIMTYLTAKRVYISGPITIRVNGELCKEGSVFIDPSGLCVHKGKRIKPAQ